MNQGGFTGYQLKYLMGALGLGFVLSAGTALAQETQTPPQARLAAANWNITCTSDNADNGFNCQLARALVMGPGNALLLRVSISLPTDKTAPSLLLQMPHGMFLPAGVTLQVDDAAERQEPVQTCDQSGCYVGVAMSVEFLAALKMGQTLKVGFRNLQKTPVTVSMPLDGFSKGYEKIAVR